MSGRGAGTTNGLLDNVDFADASEAEHLALLEVGPSASHQCLTRAYVERADVRHPSCWLAASVSERQAGRNLKFCRLSTAYDVLVGHSGPNLTLLPLNAAMATFARATLHDLRLSGRVHDIIALISSTDPRPRLRNARHFRDACVAVALLANQPAECEKAYAEMSREQRHEFLEVLLALNRSR